MLQQVLHPSSPLCLFHFPTTSSSSTFFFFYLLLFFSLSLSDTSLMSLCPVGSSCEGRVGRPRRASPMAAAAAALHRNATFASRLFLPLLLLLVLSPCLPSTAALFNRTSGRPSQLASIQIPDQLSFNAAVTATERSDCGGGGGGGREDLSELLTQLQASVSPASGALKLHLRHRSETGAASSAAARRPPKETVFESALHDLHRIQSLHRRITEKKNQNARDRLAQHHHHHRHHRHHRHRPIGQAEKAPAGQMLAASVESGVTLGSGEYLADVFVGTPPRHFSVIMDTGSDLNWLQCQPCHDCFEQHDPLYDPALSSSFRPIPCADPRCRLVSSPEPPTPCNPSSSSAAACPYFYWYGDRSNTTGDLALETFTVNLTGAGGAAHRMDGVIFGCGHWNRGLFKGAAGLLGLGRGPLSFTSQLRSGGGGGVFSYCLVDRNSDLSVSSKLVLGEDPAVMAHPLLNFTSFVSGKDNPADTFYYVGVKGIMVGGRTLDVPAKTWELTSDGTGGTIVDSGTTLSYFAEPAYQAIRAAVLKEVKAYPVVEGFPVLSPCYNVSGVEEGGALELPGLAVVFGDGAVWHFPPENCFIRLEKEEVACLAVLGTPRSSLSILGNYQQQNFHVVYDAGRSRLGFAPARCAEL